MIPPPPLHLPFCLCSLAFHRLVSTSQTACFIYVFIFLFPSVFTLYPHLLLAVWHHGAGTLESVVV